MRSIEDRNNELINKYKNQENINIIIKIEDDNDREIENLNKMFSIGQNNNFENINIAIDKLNRLLKNKIFKKNMRSNYRIELIVNNIIEILYYKNIAMSYEVYLKFRKKG